LKQVWEMPPEDMELAEEEVHVWRAFLQVSQSTVEYFRSLLSKDELLKAGRFYFDRDRHRYIVGRGVLRALLGRYLHMLPDQLRFRYNAYGKPALDMPYSTLHTLYFNSAHSREVALFAFAYDREVGVDVEYMRPDIDFEAVAKHSFSANEYTVIKGLPENEKLAAFYHCWSRKEAYIKARGMGLSLDLRLFDVSLEPGKPAALLASREDPREVGRWTFETLAPAPAYAAALAVEGHNLKLAAWDWTETGVAGL
jgi:4'-phosphopantetheinyl transferase